MDGNGNRQLEVQYINTGFPYTVTDSFMDFFDGISHQPAHYAHPVPMHDQDNAYWSMNMNSYKYGLPAHGGVPYYDPYQVHNYVPRMDLNRSAWEYPVMMNVTEPASTDVQSAESSAPSMQAIPEECSSPASQNDDSASSSQVVWQDDIDPDNMTYEELLDLGEAIGTESRGLSQELIDSLPTTRYKSGGFFLRKKSGESKHLKLLFPRIYALDNIKDATICMKLNEPSLENNFRIGGHLSFSRAVEAGIFKGYKIDPSTTLSHLFYADDAVFIGEWSHSNLKGIMNILRCFSLLSGMSINIQKSHLLGVGIPDNCVAEAAKSIGCLIMKAPFKYLGILVGDNMSSKKAWDETINKMKKRLSRWKLNTLSVGGRLTLLKSVLGSTPIYNMSIFKVPKSVLNYMESLRRNFFNGFQEGDRKIAWVKWSKVLASKKFGGLGVSSFFALNRALLFKWVWRYLSHDNSLWSRIISALHGLNGHVLSAAFNSTWSSIITEVNSLKVKGVDLISHCKIRVGKGTGTSFWKDLWIGDNLLKLSFPRLFALEENKDISVADKMNTSISSSFRRHVRGGVESQQLDQLSLLLDTVILSNMDDRWFWDLNGDGVFQVKDVRSMLDEAFLPKMEVPTRWIKSIPIKVNVFAWKLYLDRLPTRSNLSRRNVSLPSLACPLCDHVLEDSSHLFFGCSVAKDIQKLICRWWNLDVHPYESYEDWLSWFKSIRLGSKTKEVLEGVFYVFWWSLWNFRNQFLFASPIPRKDVIFDNIVLRSFYWCVARCNRTLNWVSWLQHPFLIPL
ncbi:RNA-directed DNA polymerase, eukaryota [Tanacetum coccineum]